MKIERIQKRALRHIYSDYTSTYTQLRDIANVPLLYVKRLRKPVFKAQNMINKMGLPICMKCLITNDMRMILEMIYWLYLNGTPNIWL